MFYVVDGGNKLKGTISVSGAKNVALKLIIAALLTKGKTVLHNVPRIRDVYSLMDIINTLGGKAGFISDNTVEVENTLKEHVIPIEQAARIRVSFMLMIPLLHTFGTARIPNPGGCRLGERPVDRFIEGIKAMGVHVSYSHDDGYYTAVMNSSHASDYTFAKPSHTGTEFLMMHASRISGTSVFHNVALEPEVDELITFLNGAGATVKRLGNTITVKGASALTSCEQTIGSDRNEAISFIVLSALTGGDVGVSGVQREHIETFISSLSQAGIAVDYRESTKTMRGIITEKIKPTTITTSPHPGFMTDWQPLWAVLMTQAEGGTSTIHETVYENRFGHVNELIKHGADITFFSPPVKDPKQVYQFNIAHGTAPSNQAIRISGPSTMHDAVTRMSDLRAGATLIIASLIAQGKSVIEGAQQVERGYENLIEKLHTIGARVYKIDE